MTNLFDSDNYPERMPERLIIGDFWTWKRSDLVDYPTDEYSLSYSLRLEGAGGTYIEIVATESGSEYIVEVSSATTADYTAGTYQWQEYLTRTSDSERLTSSCGRVIVEHNRETSTVEIRSHAAKALAAIEAVIEGTASKELASYSVDGVAVQRRSIDELIKLRQFYRYEVAEEENCRLIGRGMKAPGRKVRVTFDE